MAHYIRLLSDSFFFCVSIGLQVCVLAKEDHKYFSNLASSIKHVSQLGNTYLQKLQEDKLYDKYKEQVENTSEV